MFSHDYFNLEFPFNIFAYDNAYAYKTWNTFGN